jgi:streptomycin 6-kinase
VCKIAMPFLDDLDLAFDRSVRAYELTDGRGCARLLNHSTEHSALLLERLGPNLDSLGLPVVRQLEIICATLRDVWVPVPDPSAFPTGSEKAAWLAQMIASAWEELDHPCAEQTIDMALAFAAERAAAFDPVTAVFVHADAHSWNTLQAGPDTFKLVDPEGLVSEPANDLAVPMRELNDELLAGDAYALGRARAHLLHRFTGADETAIWQWGFVERVSSGLYTMQLGQDGGRDFLEVADRWAAGS